MLTKLLQHQPSKLRAQAMVEFAVVLPILIVVLIGLFEVGRLIFIYSAVNNASREAARFGAAIGYGNDGIIKYKNCAGIRAIAKRSAYFMNLQDSDITIRYDHGPNSTPQFFHTCTGTVDPGYFVISGDRILVTVTGHYQPLTRLMPWGPRTIQSGSARTILGYKSIAPNTAVPTAAVNTPVGGGATDTPTATGTATATATATFTVTAGAPVVTLAPPDTVTPGPSETPTDTPTVTPTSTLTPTPTMVTDCDKVSAGAISISGQTMSMTINNPNPYPLTVRDIYVVWNAATGTGTNDGTLLTLESVTLGDLFQTVMDSTGTKVIQPASTVTILPTSTATIIFTFVQPYQVINQNESITINLSTLGCEGHPIHSP